MSAKSFSAETNEVTLEMTNTGHDIITGLGDHCEQALANIKKFIRENRPVKPHHLRKICSDSDISHSSSGTDESEDKKDNLIGSSDSERNDYKSDISSSSSGTNESEDKKDNLIGSSDSERNDYKSDISSSSSGTNESEDKKDNLIGSSDSERNDYESDISSSSSGTNESEDKKDNLIVSSDSERNDYESDISSSSSGTDESMTSEDGEVVNTSIESFSDSEKDDSDDSFVYSKKTTSPENMQGKADASIAEDVIFKNKDKNTSKVKDVKLNDIQASNNPKDTLTSDLSDSSNSADDLAPAMPQFELCVPEGSELHNDPTFFAAAQLDKSKIFETNKVFRKQMIRYFNFQAKLRENFTGLQIVQSPPVIQAMFKFVICNRLLAEPVLIKFMKDRFDLYKNSGCAKMALFYMIMLEIYRDEKYSVCVAQDISYLIKKQEGIEYNEEEFAKVEGSYYFYVKESTEWQSENFIHYMVREQVEQMRENGEDLEETEFNFITTRFSTVLH